MDVVRRVLAILTRRFLPALVTAAGVTLVVAGLMSYDAVAGLGPPVTPSPRETPLPDGSRSPSPTMSAVPSATPAPSSGPSTAVATRIVIPAFDIDLPVVQGPDAFPYCNVAMYLKEYSQPGQPGTTYVFAHARAGMFLPLLTASYVSNGAAMLGDLVQVYTSDDKLYLYEVDFVKRHTRDFTLADQLPPGVTQQLVLQTSEGPRLPEGQIGPKLQLRADLIYVTGADHDLANPSPQIVICN